MSVLDLTGAEITLEAEVVSLHAEECGTVFDIGRNIFGPFVSVRLPSDPGGPGEFHYAHREHDPAGYYVRALKLVSASALSDCSQEEGSPRA